MLYVAIDKDPQAVSDYVLDWEPELGTDTIASSTWLALPSGITMPSTTNTTKTVTFWLSSGTNGREYELTNRITSTQGRTADYIVLVRVTQLRISVPTGPPFATVQEAIAYQPNAEGEETLKIEMVLQDASEHVSQLAPRPIAVSSTLTEAMTDSQTTIPLLLLDTLPQSGMLKIDNELLSYHGKLSPGGTAFVIGPGVLTNALRGRNATLPAAHDVDDVAEDIEYPIKARRAELAVFEWLWDTRGYKPSRSGVLGSESYQLDLAQIRQLVKGTMGRFYGGARSVSVVSSFPRPVSLRTSSRWIGNA